MARRLLYCNRGNREDAMNTFAPEFAHFWLAAPATVAAADAPVADTRNEEADREQAALEELAERVSAARSVV
jgi:hypothetical protein